MSRQEQYRREIGQEIGRFAREVVHAVRESAGEMAQVDVLLKKDRQLNEMAAYPIIPVQAETKAPEILPADSPDIFPYDAAAAERYFETLAGKSAYGHRAEASLTGPVSPIRLPDNRLVSQPYGPSFRAPEVNPVPLAPPAALGYGGLWQLAMPSGAQSADSLAVVVPSQENAGAVAVWGRLDDMTGTTMMTTGAETGGLFVFGNDGVSFQPVPDMAEIPELSSIAVHEDSLSAALFSGDTMELLLMLPPGRIYPGYERTGTGVRAGRRISVPLSRITGTIDALPARDSEDPHRAVAVYDIQPDGRIRAVLQITITSPDGFDFRRIFDMDIDAEGSLTASDITADFLSPDVTGISLLGLGGPHLPVFLTVSPQTPRLVFFRPDRTVFSLPVTGLSMQETDAVRLRFTPSGAALELPVGNGIPISVPVDLSSYPATNELFHPLS